MFWEISVIERHLIGLPAFGEDIFEQEKGLALVQYFDNYRNMEQNQISSDPLVRAASAFAALCSEQRLSVLQVLVRAGPRGLSIGELGKRSGVTGSTLTHHMRILAQADLVSQQKQGRSIICVGAAYPQVRALSEFLLTECCADASAQDQGHDHG